MNRKRIMTGLFLASLWVAGCASRQVSTPTVAAPTSPLVATEAAAPATIAPTTAATVSATTPSTTQDMTPKIVAAVNAFLATLSDTEKDTAMFDWTDIAQKQRWSNFPNGAFQRAGLMWGNMSEPQRNAWLTVLQTTLSAEGYTRVLAEWKADDAVAAKQGSSGRGGASFGTDFYFIAIIGAPSETTPWQWQWGGHHVTVNATVVGPNISLTPSFIGVEPVTYTDDKGNTVRSLGDIEDEAFALINALDATQQQAAILGSATIDLVLGPGQDGKAIQPEGLPAAEMTADQQTAFLNLIGHYTGLVNDEDGAVRTAEIKSTLDQTYLAWYGPTTQGSPAYFRITGPALVIEYSAQGNRGGTAGSDYHVHGIYRDPTNDYGAKFAQ